jgi:serine/threonine protein kinase
MDRDRWQQLSALLDEALALDRSARSAWLARQRDGDPALAGQLESMLAQAGDATCLGDDDHEQTRPAGAQFDQWLGQALAQDGAASLAGRRFGAWQLLHRIGEGGMGQVWLARRADGLYEAQAAVKLLRSDLPVASLAARFARERAVLARLDHPAIARLIDAGIEDGQAYLVLEHVDGGGLQEHVAAACPTVADRVRLLIRIAEGVEHAHAQLIVHRDLKPSNVRITRAGAPKLLDFGIAGLLDADASDPQQLTRQSGRPLTPAYAAPEQLTGAAIGTASDVFSLGVMLFELLSGTLPFAPREDGRAAIEHALLHREAMRLTQSHAGRRTLQPAAAPAGTAPGAEADAAGESVVRLERPADFGRVRGDLEAVVAKALRKPPAERYGSVRALILDLERWLSHRPVSVRRDDWSHRSRLWLQRNAWVAGATAAVLLALAGGLGASLRQWQRAEAAARQSDQVTRYLGDLLASASPDRHGGRWPTVLQLLETSREDLPRRFADDPELRLRLLGVLGKTYNELNRYDLAIPLAEARLALAAEQHGERDERSTDARLSLARIFTAQGSPQRVIELLEPLREPLRTPPPRASDDDPYGSLLYMLSVGYARSGRFDDAERTLDEARRRVEQRYAPADFERVFFANYVQVLRVAQGRLREAEALLATTEPHWATAPARHARFVLVLRRNLLFIRVRTLNGSAYEGGLPAEAGRLLRDTDQLLGPGNDMSLGLLSELSHWHADAGHADRALAAEREAARRLAAAGIDHPAARLPAEAALLLARTRAGDGDPRDLATQGHALLAQIEAAPAFSGLRRAEAWIALARSGLALGDTALAAEALRALQADASLAPDANPPLGGRLLQLRGVLERAQGGLAASRVLLERRALQMRPGADVPTLAAWGAQLELACTLAELGDKPALADALGQADARRPSALPAGHPFDAVRETLSAGGEAAGCRAGGLF